MEIENYIKSLADNCYQIYQEMTGKTALSVSIDKIERPFSEMNYKKAVIIPYQNKEDNFDGRFVLGFSYERGAVKLANMIAGHSGLPAVDEMDAMATDILFEFMNTVAGKVITEWDQFGLTADFFPPEFVTDLSFDDQKDCDLLIQSVTLSLLEEEKITILACLEETERKPLKGKKVLVVDDSKMIRFMLSKEFEEKGCEVIQAENGLDGFVKAHSAEPDLIIMDLVMPKMGGLEAIAKIREINPSVPIIVLTSTSKKEEVMAAAAHKVKGYIKKPLHMDQMLKLARSCFSSDT